MASEVLALVSCSDTLGRTLFEASYAYTKIEGGRHTGSTPGIRELCSRKWTLNCGGSITRR